MQINLQSQRDREEKFAKKENVPRTRNVSFNTITGKDNSTYRGTNLERTSVVNTTVKERRLNWAKTYKTKSNAIKKKEGTAQRFLLY